MHKRDIPDQIMSCPLKLTVYNMDRTKTIHECDLASGFYGMSQDKKKYNVKPVIGYVLISKSRKNLTMSEKEKSEILSDYFKNFQ